MDQSRTILMATDVPFWRAVTGAQQRICSLAGYLGRPPFRLTTFYLGEVTDEDRGQIAAAGWDVVYFESQRPPESFLARMAWYADATRNQLQRLVSRPGSPREPASQAPTPLRISDYRWPWAITQFRELVDRIQPDAILCQYVTMTYLLEALNGRQRKQIRCLLDTHDILHDRGMQFGTAGYLHWLEIDQAEETGLWRRYDAILAIQEEEARLIRAQVPERTVLLTPHAMEYLFDEAAACPPPVAVRPAETDGGQPGAALTIGYIGSANYSNWHAINRFLIEAWPELLELPAPGVRLLIAGKICDWFRIREGKTEGSRLMERVELAGELRQLADFYRQVDLVINPVHFGTGLKIKNVEALAFGRPLVTTPHGVAGMPERSRGVCRVARDWMDFPRQLLPLIRDPAARRQLGETAAEAARSDFSEDQAFAGLRDFLLAGG